MTTKQYFEVVNEDTVQCIFFPTSSNIEDLNTLCNSINKEIQTLSDGYIWHRDEFKVHVPMKINNSQNQDQPIRLISSTCFGDNIEDEWFIVYILLEITKQFKDVVVQILDSDGEFLLIESADVLPSWASPESTENRVFIYQNCIHLIPPTIVDLDNDITLIDAVKIVTKMCKETISPHIYHAILNRISEYPEKIKVNAHNAIVKLPIDLATLLTLKPALISPLSRAYCNHDAIEANICKKVKFEDCVLTQVKFSKCLYAMLEHSKPMKNLKHLKVNGNDKKSVLGLKVSCGYEIIMSKLNGDIFTSREFNSFINSLTNNGYFQNNLVGSEDYKQLLENAKEFFVNMESPINLQVCNSITQLINSKEFADVKEKLQSKERSVENLTQDSDDWLHVNPDELNDLLTSRYGKPSKFKSNDIIDSQKVTTELYNFLKQTSDFEGIETKDSDNEEEEEKIEFDSKEFINSLNIMINDVWDNNNDAAIDSDDFSDMDEDDLEEQEIDKELKSKLSIDKSQSENTLQNMIQSTIEEAGSTGPSSNILNTIGVNKRDLLKFGK